MKKQLILIVLMAGLSTRSGYAQIKDTDAFLNEVFAALKSQDEARFIKLYPDKNQFTRILLSMMRKEAGDDTARLNKGMAIFGEITDSSLYREFAKEFKKAMDKSKIANVKWNNAIFNSYQADTSMADDINGMELTGKIYFTSDGKEYFLSYADVIWPEGDAGWFGVVIKKIGVKGIDEENEYNDEGLNFSDSAAMDSVLMPVDSVKEKREEKIKTSSKKNNSKKPGGNQVKPKTKATAKKAD